MSVARIQDSNERLDVRVATRSRKPSVDSTLSVLSEVKWRVYMADAVYTRPSRLERPRRRK